MTANVPAPRPQIAAGGAVGAIVPQSLDEVFRVSQAIAASGLAPKGIDKAEQIMVAIMAGAELGLAPFQSLQSFAVVNGRPTLWGDGLIAVVRARGVRVLETIEGENEAMVAHCVATRPDTGEEIARTFSVADAKKAGLWGKAGPWQQYPKRMLQMRARALALRDGCADMLRGIQVREEVEDYQPIRDVTPQPSGLHARLAGRSEGAGFDAGHVARETAGEVIDAVTGEITEPSAEMEAASPASGGDEREESASPPAPPAQEDFPGDKPAPQGPTLASRVEQFKARCRDAKTVAKLDGIWGASAGLRDELGAVDSPLLDEMQTFFNGRYSEIQNEGEGQ